MLLSLLFLLSIDTLSAQTGITIGGASDLNFGTVPRSGASMVAYESGGAAHFVVTGDSGRDVRLTISTFDPAAQNGSSSRGIDRVLDLTIVNSDCAYSLDGGSSWHTFSSGALYQDTRFPNNGGNVGAIHIRIGGSLASNARQQRGRYTGTITLTAEYR